jgi:outer membrane PBP1 activator LpoA protein
MTYSFDEQLSKGQRYELLLDRYFSQWYSIQPATMEQQRKGIDRVMTHLETKVIRTVEYKADTIAGRTGNAFIETVSVDRTNKAGWAYTSQADYIVYLVTDPDTIYIIKPFVLRKRLPKWENSYQSRKVKNNGYNTVGLLVPLDELEKIAYRVV